MTRDDIIKLAREAGMVRVTSPSGLEIGEWWGVEEADIERFAALVAAAEREACALLCEEFNDYAKGDDNHHATLIRARGQA